MGATVRACAPLQPVPGPAGGAGTTTPTAPTGPNPGTGTGSNPSLPVQTGAAGLTTGMTWLASEATGATTSVTSTTGTTTGQPQCQPRDGHNNALRGPDGRFTTNPNSARSNAGPASSTHGNSRASDAYTWLYRMEGSAGNFLKWGVTSNLNGRYPQWYLVDKVMEPMTGGIRDQMLNLERWLVERDPGPDNCEPWAGAFQ